MRVSGSTELVRVVGHRVRVGAQLPRLITIKGVLTA